MLTICMRLSGSEQKIILEAFLNFDRGAEVYVFGSRLDDSKKGGDIDLLVYSTHITDKQKRQIRRDIQDKIGEQKIDILIVEDYDQAFARKARQTGVKLSGK